jgi:hypothetical protein
MPTREQVLVPEPEETPEQEPTPEPKVASPTRRPKTRRVKPKPRKVAKRAPRARRSAEAATPVKPILKALPNPAPESAPPLEDPYAELARSDPETGVDGLLADERWDRPEEEPVPRRRFGFRLRSPRRDSKRKPESEPAELVAEVDPELLTEPAPVPETEPTQVSVPRTPRRERSKTARPSRSKPTRSKKAKTSVEPVPEVPVIRYEPFPEVFPLPAPDAVDLYAELRPEWQSEDRESEPAPAPVFAFDAGNGAKAKLESPAAQQCSRCHQPSERPVCDACAEALDLLRAFSTLD